jgi:hypothetical protein
MPHKTRGNTYFNDGLWMLKLPQVGLRPLANKKKMRLFLAFIWLALLNACSPETPSADAATTVRFVPLEAIGMPQGTESAQACVQDVLTGLVWELKSNEQGLHNWRNTYSWYAPNEDQDDFNFRGMADAGTCSGSRCDTDAFVTAANAEGLCGFTDWRVPLRDELFSISELTRADNPPTVDTRFFPLTHAAEYWSSNDYSFQPESAWAWHFQFGHDRVDWKKAPKFVRLVRGTATRLTAVKE